MRQEREQSINLGKELLEKGLERSGTSLGALMKGDELASIAKELSSTRLRICWRTSASQGFSETGDRRIKAKLGIEVEEQPSLMSKMVARIKGKKSTSGIKVKGLDEMLIRFANCCHPLPGEHVLGFLTRGRGVTVHTFNCRHILDSEPERVVEVAWEPRTTMCMWPGSSSHQR